MKRFMQGRDPRPLVRRQTDFGFSYMAPAGPPPPPRFRARGCAAAATATAIALLGIVTIALGSQYASFVQTLSSTAGKPAPAGSDQTGTAIAGGGGILLAIGAVWLLGLLLLHRRRLGRPLLPRRRPVQALADEDDDEDLF